VGLPPDFTAGIEEREEREMRERAWQQHLQRVQREAPERLERLTDVGVEPEDLTAYFETLCTHPELEPYTNAPDDVPDLDAAVRETGKHLRRWQQRRPDDPDGGRDAVMKALDKAQNMLRYQDLDTPAQKAAFLELFTEVSSTDRAKVTLSRWGERGSEAYERARTLRDETLPALIEDVIAPVLRPWHAFVHRAVVDFTRPAVATFREMRRRDGQLTFHDLLQFTRDLLRDHPGIRRFFQDRYSHLLVDEFQDTDPLQAEVLFYLTSQDPTETEWTECVPRPGSLFIVGDDKQSIYRFRRADKDVFAHVGRLVDASGGEVVDLTKNFRSLGRICDFCDRAFGAIFEQEAFRDLQADYVPFDPQRPAGRDDVALRRIAVDKVPRNRGVDVASADAEQIAQFVRAAVAGEVDDRLVGAEDAEDAVFPGGAGYEDFMILTRTKTRLSVYAETLARHGIPYTVTGSEDLGESDELQAVVDLLTCALRPDDPVAVVATLKGPFVGLSDDDLYRYRRAGGRFDAAHEPVPGFVQQALREEGDAELAGRVEEAFDHLREARTLLLEKRPAVAVEEIVDTFGLLAGAAHPPDASEGSLRAGYVVRIVTLVQHLAAQRNGWATVLDELQRVLDGEDDVDGMTLETGSGGAVRIMNVHQAKGLEAPVVFLADPYSTGSSGAPTLHVRRETDEIVAPVVQGEGYYQRVTHAPLGWDDGDNRPARDRSDAESFSDLEERHEDAEEQRLLYVAATRAENMLVVSTYPEKPDDGYWSDLYPHLDAAGAPELEGPDAMGETGEGDIADARTLTAPAPDLETHRLDRERRIDRAAQASYQEVPVTNLVRPVDVLGQESGYGPEFGEVVHRLFEECIEQRPDVEIPSKEYVTDLLREKEASTGSGALDRARALVHNFLNSELWSEICAAEEVYPEYPVASLRPDATGAEPSALMSGQVDVVYRDDEGWKLVDFKTAGTDAPGALEALTDAYAPQVEAYARAWAEATGEPLVSASLWFAEEKERVEVQ
jgi:ATP-dependent helicase/nuclease subunit A